MITVTVPHFYFVEDSNGNPFPAWLQIELDELDPRKWIYFHKENDEGFYSESTVYALYDSYVYRWCVDNAKDCDGTHSQTKFFKARVCDISESGKTPWEDVSKTGIPFEASCILHRI